MHEYTYAMPLFCCSIFENFQSIRLSMEKFEKVLREEINKMKGYIQKMEQIASMASAHLDSLHR